MESAEAGEAVAVLSHAFLLSRFGGSREALSQTITIRERAFRIAGVLDAAFTELDTGSAPDLWIALPKNQGGRVIVRIRDSAERPRALAALQAAFNDYSREHPNKNAPQQPDRSLGSSLRLVPASHGLASNRLTTRFGTPLEIALVATFILVLIASVNVALLMLARGAARTREIGIRIALGAKRSRIASQVLMEAGMIAAAGCASGFMIARWGHAAITALISDPDRPIRLPWHPDWRVFSLACLLLGAVTLGAGTVPALRAARTDVNSAMRGRAALTIGRRRFRLSEVFVVAQMSLSLTLLTAAALLLSSLWNLNNADPGFGKDDVLIADLQWQREPRSRIAADTGYRAALRALKAVSGVVSASISGWSYFEDNSRRASIVIEGSDGNSATNSLCEFMSVGPEFFRTMGSTLISGREFNDADTEQSRLVAILNETGARLYFGHRRAIGESFHIFDPKETTEVIGIARDTKLHSLRSAAPPMVYLPFLQSKYQGTSDYPASLAVRIGRSGAIPMRELQRAVAASWPGLNVVRVRSQRLLVNKSLTTERLLAHVASWFGLFGLLLASVGLYGVMAQSLAQRRKEFGIRIALGASGPEIVKLTEVRVLVLSASAGIVGLPAIAGISRITSAFLFDVAPGDPRLIASALAVMTTAALLAGWLPARRAARINPSEILRSDT
jgi:putative ABC transport system permease protein